MDKVVLTNDNTTSMASIERKVKPFKESHSIKEVVISVFLSNSIELEEFAKIKLPGIFSESTRVDEVKSLKIPFNNGKIDIDKSDSFKPQTVGKRFVIEEQDSIVKLLQGINEENRTFISYHSLDYSRWATFFDEYLQYITQIALSLKDISVQAFSLHYIDEFKWLEKSNIEPRDIFNVNSRYVPNEFFNVLSGSFNLTTEKVFESNTCYDRIEIRTENTNSTISISHNLTRVLNQQTQLLSLIQLDEFTKILTWAHNQNKDFLKEILHKDIVRLINLT